MDTKSANPTSTYSLSDGMRFWRRSPLQAEDSSFHQVTISEFHPSLRAQKLIAKFIGKSLCEARLWLNATDTRKKECAFGKNELALILPHKPPQKSAKASRQSKK
jgi:hypothetical protein